MNFTATKQSASDKTSSHLYKMEMAQLVNKLTLHLYSGGAKIITHP